MSDYQLIVIGAGPGGYNAAVKAAKLGLKTAIVEAREAGGTCLNRGCVPTKSLLHSAKVYKEVCASPFLNVEGSVSANVRAMFDKKNEVSQKLSKGIESLFKSSGVALYKGLGQIVAEGTVEVTAEDGVKKITADNILVATGSVPARPPIPGLDLPGIMTSDEILEGSDEVYPSLIIMGGGVIGAEFATFFSSLGTKVTVIEGMDRLLPLLDKELGQSLAMQFKREGIAVQTGSMIQKVEKNGENFVVTYKKGDAEGTVEAAKVLCAIGRVPYVGKVFGPGMEPEMDRRRVKVDENFATSIPGVYAIGDVSSKIQLAHVATAQGLACVEKLAGVEPETDVNLVPSCIYCSPEIASVGLTEAEAKEKEIPVKVGKAVLGANARTLISGAGRSFMKVLVHAENRQILGAQLMCENCTDMISEIAEAVANKLTVEQMLAAMRPHPTFEEALTDALEDARAKLG